MYCGKEEKSLLFSTIFCYLLLDFHVKTGTRFSVRDKRLFEINEFEITRVESFWTPYLLSILLTGLAGWCEGVVYLTSLGRPTDIGLQLGKANYPCSR